MIRFKATNPADIKILKELGTDLPNPKVNEFSEQDWVDFFYTMARFKLRVKKRRYDKLNVKSKKVKD